MGARAGPDGELRIVRDGRTRADQDRVGERPQPVQMAAVLLTGDVVGVPGAGRDESVEALPQLGERDTGPREAQREVAVGEVGRLGARGPGPAPAAVRSGDEPGGTGVRRRAHAEQPPPRLVPGQLRCGWKGFRGM